MRHSSTKHLLAALVALSVLTPAIPFAISHGNAAAAMDHSDPKAIAGSQASLAWKLIASAAPGSNAQVSPASLASAFSVLTLGSDAKMTSALLKAAGLDALDTNDAETILATARKDLAASDPAVFISADRLVFPPATPPRELIAAGLDKLGVSYAVADVSKAEGVKSVDDWVNEDTKGAIPQILGAPLDRPAFVALNALHFKAKWKEAFDPNATGEAPFNDVGGIVHPAKLMKLPEAQRAYRADKDFVGVELPFAGDRYALVVVTSIDQPRPLKAFEPVKSWMAGEGFATRKGDLAMPSFSLETQTDLLPSLKKDLGKGLESPTALAGFGVAPSIEGILQRTKIEINEEGAEAAAVTAVVVTRSLALDDALHMIVDKPFLFSLRDKTSGLIIVEGYVANPKLK